MEQDLIELMKCQNCRNAIFENGKLTCSESKREVSYYSTCPLFSEQLDEQETKKIVGYFKALEQATEQKQIKAEFLSLVKDKKFGEATELIVSYIERNYHIYTTKDDNKSEMWIYKEGIYTPQGKSEVKEIMRAILGNWYSAFFYNQVINKLEPDTFIDNTKFFLNNNLEEIPLQNGVLNIFTRELKEFTPNKIFFTKLPVVYDKEASCPRIDKFLSEVLTNEQDKQVFYEWAGFCLLKDYKFEKAMMLIGNGRNGKDKSLELIKRLVGVENCCSVPLVCLVPDSFIISEFFNKMINIAGDIDNKDLKDTSHFKALTGRSLISAPRKFLNAITFQNYAKFTFACNDLPMVYDTSKGFWDRWILLEYPYTFVTKEEYEKAKDKTKLKIRDENIIDKITSPAELSGLLNSILDGLDRLIASKSFSTTKGSEEVKNLWIRKSNSFMAFCLDCLESDYENYITKKELRKRYAEYCKQHKITPKTDYVIKRTLEEMFGTIESTKNTLVNYQEKVWEGIKFKSMLNI